MTDHSTMDVEHRVRVALNRLADRHEPDVDHRWPSGHPNRQGDSSGPRWNRRVLLVAATLMLVVAGVGAIAVVQDRDGTSPVDTAPGPTAPTTTASKVPVDDARSLRFADPLDAGIVALLDPARASPVAAYDIDSDVDEWPLGRDGSWAVWVLEDDEWVNSLTVIDQAVPFDTAAAGLTATTINGTDAVIDTSQATVALRLPNGGTRVILSGADGPAQMGLLDTAVQLADVIGTGPPGAALPTDQFVAAPTETVQGPVVRYNSGDAEAITELVIYRFTETPTDDQLRWMTAAMAQANDVEQIDSTAYVAVLDSGQQAMLELVSPLDAVGILAPADADMSTLRDSLVFASADDAGITIEPVDPYPTPVIAARGEADWGRWQVSTSLDDRCRSVASTLWTAGQLTTIPTGTSTCDPETPFGPAICSSPGPGLQLVIVLDAEAAQIDVQVAGQPITQTMETGDRGAAVLIDNIPPGPNPITLTVDGTETTCGPV